MLVKAYILENGPLKVILVRAQKEKRSAVEKASVFLDYLSNPEQNIGRNMDGKGHSNEVSDGNKKYTIENWGEGNLCYKVTKDLAELCSYPRVLWKVELVGDEIGYLAEEISK